MSGVHGYKPVGFLNGGHFVALSSEEAAKREMLEWVESKGLTLLYASQHPKGCPATLAGGHVGGGLRCERGCRTLHACAARREQPERQPEYPAGHVLRPWAVRFATPGTDHACNLKLRAEGTAYPRTCAQCGLGPCHNKVRYEGC